MASVNEVVVRDADDLTVDEIVETVTALKVGSILRYGCTIFFEMGPGCEELLTAEFPDPNLSEEVSYRLRDERVSVQTRIRSWQDPEHEEQQAAWCIVIEW